MNIERGCFKVEGRIILQILILSRKIRALPDNHLSVKKSGIMRVPFQKRSTLRWIHHYPNKEDKNLLN